MECAHAVSRAGDARGVETGVAVQASDERGDFGRRGRFGRPAPSDSFNVVVVAVFTVGSSTFAIDVEEKTL